MSWLDDTPDKEIDLTEEVEVLEASYDDIRQDGIDREFIEEVYKVPAEDLANLLKTVDRLGEIKAEMDRYLVSTILNRENPIKEPK